MERLKIALLQILPCGSLDNNLEKGIQSCRQAKKMEADIALFPEMWSCGYDIYSRTAYEWMKDAIPADSAFVESFRHLARELNMAIGITLLEKYKDGVRNTLLLFDRHGEKKQAVPVVHFGNRHSYPADTHRQKTVPAVNSDLGSSVYLHR